ncbi:thiamine-phosphate pyrophosphorylase [Devosia lucknowensis]|uniref:Thiamine-phosphate pyrophosphorylase n=1 Tax=Devosia lucknowensis TaxID=1096929 RepID=A0A1Y6FEF1_9HYPH|nr:thiamine phosphate synthase [Devosia lucknowensis]SMQ73029.1 thiamine-phosphate pyrophosphorylase [Devosia lucknowensis]
MAPQLYLITPEAPNPEQFPRQLMGVLSGPEVAALLIRRGALDDAGYAAMAERIVQIGQAAGAAVLIEDDVEMARTLGADGVHVTSGGVKAIRAAVAALKPDGIVGAGNVRTRHDAMSFGELDVDYLMFGPLGGATDPQAAELAQWWAETFEVPAIYSDPAADQALVTSTPAEFLALSDCVWAAPDAGAALSGFDKAVKASA